MSNSNKKELEVEVFWPPTTEQEKFKGKAQSVSSENRLGKFDILPEHANFISLIFNSLTIRTLEGQKIKYEFSRGVLETSENRVRIFLEL